MAQQTETTQFKSQVEQLNALLDRIEQMSDPAIRSQMQQMMQSVLGLYGEALARIVAAAEQADPQLLESLVDDQVVTGVLLIHGLHPLDLTARVNRALEKVGPYVASHGGHVELLSVSDEGVVKLRLHGSCHGCPSSRVTLETSIEQEIYSAAPEVVSIEVEGLAEPAPAPPVGFVPIECIAINGSAAAAVAT